MQQGVQLASRGLAAKADQKMAEALDSSVRLGMQYDQAVVLFYTGMLAKDDPDKGPLLIKKAQSMFEVFGCKVLEPL